MRSNSKKVVFYCLSEKYNLLNLVPKDFSRDKSFGKKLFTQNSGSCFTIDHCYNPSKDRKFWPKTKPRKVVMNTFVILCYLPEKFANAAGNKLENLK